MIKYADKNMIPSLKEIWKECFGDEDYYIDFFFDNYFSSNKILTWVEKEKPVSMLTLIEAHLYIDKKYYPIYYVYAVATRKSYRGQGISTKLLNYINNSNFIYDSDKNYGIQNLYIKNSSQSDNLDMKKNNLKNKENIIPTMLVPADNGLFSYYKNRGYIDYFYIKELEIAKIDDKTIYNNEILLDNIIDKSIKLEISDISSKEYKILRDAAFLRDGYISWSNQSLDYILRENELCSGKTKKIIYNNKQYIIMFYKNEDILYIKETSIMGKELMILVQKFIKLYDCKKAIVRLPGYVNVDIENNNVICRKKRFGMISESFYDIFLGNSTNKQNNDSRDYLLLNKKNLDGYINLVLD